MNTNKRFDRNSKIPRPPFSYVFTETHLTAIYTVLCILRQMKRELGLEAMLEYLDKYLEAVETPNPELRAAVEKALKVMSVAKMYRDAMR